MIQVRNIKEIIFPGKCYLVSKHQKEEQSQVQNEAKTINVPLLKTKIIKAQMETLQD